MLIRDYSSVDIGRPLSDHPLNFRRVLWWLALPNLYGGGRAWNICGPRHGDLTNSPLWVAGLTFGGLTFSSGSSQYVNFGAQSFLTTTNLVTVACTVRANATARGDLVTRWDSGSTNDDQFNLLYGLSGLQSRFFIRNGAVSATGGNLSTTEFIRLVGTYDGGTVRIYSNGVETGSTVATQSWTTGSTIQTRIGGNSNTDGFANATMRDVSIWDRCLTAAEVAAEYFYSRKDYKHSDSPLRWRRRTFLVPEQAAGGSDTTVTPITASLTLTTFAPTISTPRLVTPTTASLTLTTFAPIVSTPRLCTPTTKALALTTFAPTVNAGQTATPTTASLTLTTFAPTVSTTQNQRVTPTTAALSLTAFAPTVTTPRTATPTTAGLTITLFAPTVSTPRTATPTTLALTLATFAPTVTVGGSQTATPLTATLVLTGYAPTVTATGTFTFDTVCPLPIPLVARTPLPVPMVARDPIAVPLVGCRNEV